MQALFYTIYNEKYFSDNKFSYIVHVLTWRAQKMRSPTCSEDSLLVRIIVPCAQTSLPGPRGNRDAFSSLSERRKHRTLRQACSACHQALSEVREVMSTICHGMVVDSMFKQTSPLHGEFEQLLLACSEGCGLHHNSKVGAAFICAC